MATGYMDNVNEVYEALCELVEDADLSNTSGYGVKFVKRALPAHFGPGHCPLIAIFKDELSERNVDTDQEDVQAPEKLKVIVGISDFSAVDLDDAGTKTDDLINQLITLFETDPSLGGLGGGIEITRIGFSSDNRSDVWFSEPSMEIEILCKNL